MKIGLLAGGGDLPKYVAKGAGDQLAITIALKGFANPQDFVGAQVFALGQFGKVVRALKKAKVSHICFAGIVDKPDFKKLKPDLKAISHLPSTIRAAGQGDDALLRHILGLFEAEGFEIMSPQSLCENILLKEGALGALGLSKPYRDDALKACETARQIGQLDIGQGAVVARGVVLAVEAQEGTDAMLARVAAMPLEARKDGVLAKLIKPHQDIRVDLPTLGPETIRRAAEAGLAGIVAEAGGAFVLNKDEVKRLADEAGLFVVGLPKGS